MEKKKYVCPVCQKECENLMTLNECIARHIEYEKYEREEAKTKEINRLKTENENLVRQIEENCKKLKKFEITANIKYNIFEKRYSQNFRDLNSTEPNSSKENIKSKSVPEKMKQSDIDNFVKAFLDEALGIN